MTAADGRTESRLCLNLLLQKLCCRKKLSRALGIEKNAAVIVNCKGALSVGNKMILENPITGVFHPVKFGIFYHAVKLKTIK